MATTYINGARQAYTSERLATLTSSTGLTSTNYRQVVTTTSTLVDQVRYAEEVLITVETADIRYTIDGTTPTTTATTALGHLASAGTVISIAGHQNIKNFRAINAVASSGSAIYATYLR